jgi:TIR domain
MPDDVFLSYASEDRERARTVAEAFQQQGWSMWWDPDIDAGAKYGDAIKEALEGARCVVVLWSKASIASDWVHDEAGTGRKRGVLVPASLDGSDPPLGFGQIQTAQLDGWDGDEDHPGFRLLRDGVAARIAAGPKPEAGERPRPRRRWILPKWASASALGGLLGAVLLLAGLVLTDNVHSGPAPTPAPTPYPGGLLATRVNVAVPELGCRSWGAGDEKGDPNPFRVGVAAACISSEVKADSTQDAVPEIVVYLFGPVGPLQAQDLRDAFWGLKIYRKGLTRNRPDGALCASGTCGCPFGVPGEGTYPKRGNEYTPRISCGYSDDTPGLPELRWRSGKQLYGRIIFRKIPMPPDPSPAPGASPGESPVPAPAVRADQRIIDLYQWWLLHHREIEAAIQGVVPLPTP